MIIHVPNGGAQVVLDLKDARAREAARFYAVLVSDTEPEVAAEIEREVMLVLAADAAGEPTE